tara:strand:- start:821 stop:1438 length:618 start_codon:yes stop_codon:yes gene_type:complete
MNREILFPTPVYFKTVKDPKKLNKYLFPLIKAWSKKDKGEIKTNAGGGWHSPTNMNFKKEYKPLTDELFMMQEEIYRDYGMEPKAALGNMWANVNNPGAYNKKHIHPNSQWSGVYYVKVPKNSGSLFVEDPRPGPNIIMPRRLKNLPRQLWNIVVYPAIEGQIIMFPAWLPHGVEINKSKEKGEKGWRVSISFNFIQVDKDGRVG